MSFLNALVSGLAGAAALNVLHESARQVVPAAPKVHLTGERALKKIARRANLTPPTGNRLYATTLAADVASNALYYSAVGLGKPEHAPRNGGLLGLVAGVGAVLLPGPMGLGNAPTARTAATTAMTIGWYTVGGLVAGLVYRQLAQRRHPHPTRRLADGREWNF
jgi:hypothetical protein